MFKSVEGILLFFDYFYSLHHFEGDNNGKYIIRIKELIESIRYTKSFFQNLYFVFEGINDENFFKEILIEENNNKAFPYDFNHFYEKIVGRNYK